jgi:hypothetical protein
MASEGVVVTVASEAAVLTDVQNRVALVAVVWTRAQNPVAVAEQAHIHHGGRDDDKGDDVASVFERQINRCPPAT